MSAVAAPHASKPAKPKQRRGKRSSASTVMSDSSTPRYCDRAREPPAGEMTTTPIPAISLSASEGTPEATTAPQPEEVHDENAIILDPEHSERKYWRDALTGVQREIWRPGDGDGDYAVEYCGKLGKTPGLGQGRWRFYQLTTGPITKRANELPKNVLLDDRAAHAVLNSNLDRTYLVRNWSHDFAGAGHLRSRRPHRGRPALADPAAEGNDKYHSASIGMKKKEKYYFSGEKDYQAVIYRLPPPPPQQLEVPGEAMPVKPRQHNQYTPAELLVKNGAESKSQTRGRLKARVNSFLRRSPSPPWARNRGRLYGGNWEQAGAVEERGLGLITERAGGMKLGVGGGGAASGDEAEEESMWVQQDESSSERGEPSTPGDDELGQAVPTPSSVAHSSDPDQAATPLSPPLRGKKHRASPPPSPAPCPKRTKPSQPASFNHSRAAEDDPASDPVEPGHDLDATTSATPTDTGSYAAQLEAELERARTALEAQSSELEALRDELGRANSRLRGLERELAAPASPGFGPV